MLKAVCAALIRPSILFRWETVVVIAKVWLTSCQTGKIIAIWMMIQLAKHKIFLLGVNVRIRHIEIIETTSNNA